MHAYSIQAGRFSHTIYGDDPYARRVVARYLRLFWPHLNEDARRAYLGCSIRRSPRLYESGVIPRGSWPLIESFELEPEPIAEFLRVAC